MKLWKLALLAGCVAVAETYILVVTGLDWNYFLVTRGPLVQHILFPAAILGAVVPVLLPIVLYVKRQRLQAGAIVLASVTGWVASSTLKAFTGRAHPDFLATAQQLQNSADFKFGFFRGGIFWGWPSSHTTVAFAMAVTFICLYPKKPWLKYLALTYAVYIGLGVSTNIHWLSDVFAGTLLGTLIGLTLGRYFSKLLTKAQ